MGYFIFLSAVDHEEEKELGRAAPIICQVRISDLCALATKQRTTFLFSKCSQNVDLYALLVSIYGCMLWLIH